jgi:nicotinamidase-related amidase
MSEADGAPALDGSAVHLAVDLQRLFAEAGPWFVPWMPKVLPRIAALARRHPERTVLTRFIPPREPADLPGAWSDALCSSNDTSHDTLLSLYRRRFGQQIATSSTEEVLSRWE